MPQSADFRYDVFLSHNKGDKLRVKGFIYCQACDEKVPLIDFIEQRLKSDPVARKILAMDEAATREQDAQALEQILIGHMMAIAGEATKQPPAKSRWV